MTHEVLAYADPSHPSNKLRSRTRCWGCGKLGCVGKHWGNWCFECNVKRLDRINKTMETLHDYLAKEAGRE